MGSRTSWTLLVKTIVLTEQLSKSKRKLRWYQLSPGRTIFLLLAIESVLLISNWLHWIPKGFAVLVAVAAVVATMLHLFLWFVVALVFRRPFQFSIRSLLLVTVGVAVPCSWFVAEIGEAKNQRELIQSLGEHSDYLPKDGEGVGTHHIEGVGYNPYMPGGNLRGPDFLCRWLGYDFFNDVQYVSVRMITDEDLGRLKSLRHLRSLQIRGRKLCDADLDQLRSLTDLEWISLWQEAEITDRGMQNLIGMRQLKALEFRETKITDEGLRCLGGATQIVSLEIGGTRFTDAGLEHLEGFSELKKLCLRNLELTEAGVDRLKVLPNLQELSLLPAKCTDAGLQRLKELTRLKKLGLSLDDMTDDRLVHVQGLVALDFLTLFDEPISGKGLKNLRELPNLKTIRLVRTNTTDADLENLDFRSGLMELSLTGNPIRGPGLKALKRIGEIGLLSLNNTEIDEDAPRLLGGEFGVAGTIRSRPAGRDLLASIPSPGWTEWAGGFRIVSLG